MVKTFDLCAPSLSEGSAFKPIHDYFSTVEFPINLTIRNYCPFSLVIPAAGIELAHVTSEKAEGVFVVRCLSHLMSLVSSVEQIAELNRVGHAVRICYACADEIEEPEEMPETDTVETPETDTVETVETQAEETAATPVRRRRGRPSRKIENA